MSAIFVSTRGEIQANLRRFEAALKLPKSDARRAAADALAARGSCFLAYVRNNGRVAFSPSRFVGYVANDVLLHSMRKKKADGRLTNVAIDRALNETHLQDLAFESQYQLFCEEIGIEPSATGAGGSPRKFWISKVPPELVASVQCRSIDDDRSLSETQRKQLHMARIGQGIFRSKLLQHWKTCCLTGCAIGPILKASHIKPWSNSTNKERLDKFNGLLLSPNADALFDKGLISFSDDGTILVSKRVSRSTVMALLGAHKTRIAIGARHLVYLRYHRNEVFNRGFFTTC